MTQNEPPHKHDCAPIRREKKNMCQKYLLSHDNFQEQIHHHFDGSSTLST